MVADHIKTAKLLAVTRSLQHNIVQDRYGRDMLNRILAENVSNIITNSPDDIHNLTSYYDDDFSPMNQLQGQDLPLFDDVDINNNYYDHLQYDLPNINFTHSSENQFDVPLSNRPANSSRSIESKASRVHLKMNKNNEYELFVDELSDEKNNQSKQNKSSDHYSYNNSRNKLVSADNIADLSFGDRRAEDNVIQQNESVTHRPHVHLHMGNNNEYDLFVDSANTQASSDIRFNNNTKALADNIARSRAYSRSRLTDDRYEDFISESSYTSEERRPSRREYWSRYRKKKPYYLKSKHRFRKIINRPKKVSRSKYFDDDESGSSDSNSTFNSYTEKGKSGGLWQSLADTLRRKHNNNTRTVKKNTMIAKSKASLNAAPVSKKVATNSEDDLNTSDEFAKDVGGDNDAGNSTQQKGLWHSLAETLRSNRANNTRSPKPADSKTAKTTYRSTATKGSDDNSDGDDNDGTVDSATGPKKIATKLGHGSDDEHDGGSIASVNDNDTIDNNSTKSGGLWQLLAYSLRSNRARNTRAMKTNVSTINRTSKPSLWSTATKGIDNNVASTGGGLWRSIAHSLIPGHDNKAITAKVNTSAINKTSKTTSKSAGRGSDMDSSDDDDGGAGDDETVDSATGPKKAVIKRRAGNNDDDDDEEDGSGIESSEDSEVKTDDETTVGNNGTSTQGGGLWQSLSDALRRNRTNNARATSKQPKVKKGEANVKTSKASKSSNTKYAKAVTSKTSKTTSKSAGRGSDMDSSEDDDGDAVEMSNFVRRKNLGSNVPKSYFYRAKSSYWTSSNHQKSGDYSGFNMFRPGLWQSSNYRLNKNRVRNTRFVSKGTRVHSPSTTAHPFSQRSVDDKKGETLVYAYEHSQNFQNKVSPADNRHVIVSPKSLIPHVRSRYNLSPKGLSSDQKDSSSISNVKYQPYKQFDADLSSTMGANGIKVVTPVTMPQFQSLIKEDIELKSDLAKYYSSVQSPKSTSTNSSSHEKPTIISTVTSNDMAPSDEDDAATDYSSDFVVPIDLIKSPSSGNVSEANGIQNAIDLNQIVKRAREAQMLTQVKNPEKKSEDEIMFRYRLSEFQRKTNNLPPYDCVDLIIGDMHSPKFKSFLKKEA